MGRTHIDRTATKTLNDKDSKHVKSVEDYGMNVKMTVHFIWSYWWCLTVSRIYCRVHRREKSKNDGALQCYDSNSRIFIEVRSEVVSYEQVGSWWTEVCTATGLFLLYCSWGWGKEMRAAQHEAARKKPLIWCKVAKDDVASGETVHHLSREDTKRVTRTLPEMFCMKKSDKLREKEGLSGTAFVTSNEYIRMMSKLWWILHIHTVKTLCKEKNDVEGEEVWDSYDQSTKYVS